MSLFRLVAVLATLALPLPVCAEECDPGGRTTPQADPGQGEVPPGPDPSGNGVAPTEAGQPGGGSDQGAGGPSNAPSPAEQVWIEGLFTDPCATPWLLEGTPTCVSCPEWLITLPPGLLPETGRRPPADQDAPAGAGGGTLTETTTSGGFFAREGEPGSADAACLAALDGVGKKDIDHGGQVDEGTELARQLDEVGKKDIDRGEGGGEPDSAVAACLAALDDVEEKDGDGGEGGDPPSGGDGGTGPSVEGWILQAMAYRELAGRLDAIAEAAVVDLRDDPTPWPFERWESTKEALRKQIREAREAAERARKMANECAKKAVAAAGKGK